MSEIEIEQVSVEDLDVVEVESSEQWQARHKLKALQKERDNRLNSLSHTLEDGRVIQCRLIDEQPIRNAIDRMVRLGLAEQKWRMADNTASFVTVADLEAALVTGQDRGAEVWEWFLTTTGQLQ